MVQNSFGTVSGHYWRLDAHSLHCYSEEVAFVLAVQFDELLHALGYL